MGNKTFNARIKNKRDTSANWVSKDPVLLDGELIIVDTASGETRFKVGDGTSKWSELNFIGGDQAKNFVVTPNEGESDIDAIIRVVGATELHSGDTAIVKHVITDDKISYTAYVYDSDKWELLGDEGSYALKTELNTKVSKSGDTFSGTLTYNGGTTGSNPNNIAIDIGQGNLYNIDTIDGVNRIHLGECDSSGSLNKYAFLTTYTDSDGAQHLLTQQVVVGDYVANISLGGIGLPTQDDEAANKYYVDNKVNALTAADVGAATIADIATEIGMLDVTEIGGTGKYIQSIQQTDGKISATAGTMPTALKNPNALTFTGAVTGTYDGSAAKTVNIPAAITVDEALSNTSTNPIQNKAVANAIVGEKSDTGTSAEIFNDYAHNLASGNYSHAEGNWTEASGNYSHAQNDHTLASHDSQTAMGKYNSNKADTLLEVGNGAGDGARSNAFEVYDDGHAEVKTMGATDNSLTTKKYVDARIPAATTANNGQFLRVVNGVPTWVALNVAEEVLF